MVQPAADDFVELSTPSPSTMTSTGEGNVSSSNGEVRVVNERTGGMKNSKPVFFDLVPDSIYQAIATQPSVAHSFDSMRLWWSDGGNFLLEEIAYDLAAHLAINCGSRAAALWEVAAVYGQGAEKYSPSNWMRGYDWSLSVRAFYRHVAKHMAGEKTDPESGRNHLAHALFHVASLLYFVEHHPELDDRPHRERAA